MSSPDFHLRGGRYVSTPEHAQACATVLGHANDPELTAALQDLFRSIDDSAAATREFMQAVKECS